MMATQQKPGSDLGNPSSPTNRHILYATDLTGQPSCIAFPPREPGLLVIGTYQLDKNPNQDDSDSDSESEEPHSQDSRSETQNRSGTVQLLRFKKNRKIDLIQKHYLLPFNSLEKHIVTPPRSTGAVLDLRFCPRTKYEDILAISTSTGLIVLFRLTVDYGKGNIGMMPSLELIAYISVLEQDVLVTSLSWDPFHQENIIDSDEYTECKHDLAITSSDGRVAVLGIPMPGSRKEPTVVNLESRPEDASIRWIEGIHDESAWVVQWATNRALLEDKEGQRYPRELFTGGDDASIHRITLPKQQTVPRMAPSHQSPETRTISNTGESEAELNNDEEDIEEKALHAIDIQSQATKKQTATHIFDSRTHTAGVTSIVILPADQSLVQQQQIILTGSYDNYLRILSIPQTTAHQTIFPRQWPTLAEIDLGGGVWKLDLLGSRTETYLDLSQEDNVSKSRETKYLILCTCMQAGIKIVEIVHRHNLEPKSESESESEQHQTASNRTEESGTMHILQTSLPPLSPVAISPPEPEPKRAGVGAISTVTSSPETAAGLLQLREQRQRQEKKQERDQKKRKQARENGPLCYASTWQALDSMDGGVMRFRIVGTSFYDQRVWVWDFEWR